MGQADFGQQPQPGFGQSDFGQPQQGGFAPQGGFGDPMGGANEKDDLPF